MGVVLGILIGTVLCFPVWWGLDAIAGKFGLPIAYRVAFAFVALLVVAILLAK